MQFVETWLEKLFLSKAWLMNGDDVEFPHLLLVNTISDVPG